MIWLIVGLILIFGIGGWLLFRDSMNRFQCLERLRLYWVTRDVGKPGTPHIKKAWMRQTADPWWRGRGIEFRIGKYTFQVGRLMAKGNGLPSQISNLSDYDPSLDEIKKWIHEDT